MNNPLDIHEDYKLSRNSDIETMSVTTAKSHPINSSEKKYVKFYFKLIANDIITFILQIELLTVRLKKDVVKK